MKWILENKNDCIQECLSKGQFYCQDELQIMSNYIKENANVIDIGANIGNHTVYFSKFTKTKTIYVIEPIEKSYKMLLCNIALNYCHNVNVDYLGVGLGNFEGIVYPYTVYGKNNLGSTRMFLDPNPIDFIEDHRKYYNYDPETFSPVHIIKGDSIFADKKIDFIKIDAEGMDLVIIEGLEKTIEKNRPVIFAEIINENFDDFKYWTNLNNYKIEKEFLQGAFNPNDIYSGKNYLILPNE